MPEVNTENTMNTLVEGSTIVKTDIEAKDGQNKCPKCGATEISLDTTTGKLRCNFCRHEFTPQKAVGLDSDINELKGHIVGSGAQNIVADTDDILTFKCSSCGAEVVIDTNEATHARCHWCRHTLSVNQQIPNGAVPDMILPFAISKDVAQAEIEKFVGKKKFFAHQTFTKEFTTANVMGVYLPYMVVDINAHANFVGEGEKTSRKYTKEIKGKEATYYDADCYDIGRDFDIAISGLTVESSTDKADMNVANKTNNIINSIMPFDVENSVRWDANYLKGYTSERRDTNVEQLQELVNVQATDVARYKINDDIEKYDRGVAWNKEQLDIEGQRWKAAYLPVWLYSYQQMKKNGESALHYVAVNARTKETMGSVPLNMSKLIGVSAILELLGILLWMYIGRSEDLTLWAWPLAVVGPVFFSVMYYLHRNLHARHKHELETKAIISNLQRHDQLVKTYQGLKTDKMEGANNTRFSGRSMTDILFDTTDIDGPVGDLINKYAKKNDK